MTPTWIAATSDLRRHKLQMLVIAIVIMLASGAATLALSLLVESDAPFDHAFAQANGAHLTIVYDAHRVTPGQLRQTAHASGVTAHAGPWPQVQTGISTAGPGLEAGVFTNIAGRSSPDTPVDRVTVESGRWVRSPGEIVLSQRASQGMGAGAGSQVNIQVSKSGSPQTFTVVGIAASVSPFTGAWVLPSDVGRLVSASSPLGYQMLYRLQHPATESDIQTGEQAIVSHLPGGSVTDTSNYIDVKRNADLTTGVMIPFLLAFSIFGLLAAVLIITNVVTGVIIAGYRDFGVMKSIGFTPRQVASVLLGEMLVPVLGGALVGIPVGTAASQPFLQQTAEALGLPAPFTAVIPVDLAVLLGVLVTVALSVLVPAWRAARMSAVAAITRGTAPDEKSARGVHKLLGEAPLPRPLSLGIADALARPVRSFTTFGAILIGVATVIFALNLHLSLGMVASHLIRDQYAPVTIQRPTGLPSGPIKQGAPTPSLNLASESYVTNLIRSNSHTARYVAEAQVQARVPGIAQPINYYAYRGDSSWLGYAMISGRWFSAPGEVVAPTKLINEAHLRVGQNLTIVMNGKLVRVRLVGEVFDQADNDLLLRGTWASAAAAYPGLQASDYELRPKSGINPDSYAIELDQAAGPGNTLSIRTVERSSANATFVLLNGVIAGLALILTIIAVAGVFNTVVLMTREKVRDTAILKAIGMAPRQVVAMVISSVAFLGVVAGLIGIPAGFILHRAILQFMGQVATGTAIPPSFFDPINHALLPFLALAGVAIAALGAWLPAQWASMSKVADVLQAE